MVTRRLLLRILCGIELNVFFIVAKVFEPFPKQEEFIQAVLSGKYSLLCYGGAMGGGKSYVCLMTLILLAKIYPKSKWCVIRESLPTIKKTTLETFNKLVPQSFVTTYNQQEFTYTFNNGSQIFFMAEDFRNDKDFDRFKGLEVNGFLLEQIEELQEELLSVCFVRAGRHNIEKMPPRPLILCNVNPTLAWPKQKIYDRHRENNLPPDWYYQPARIMDNPVLYNDVQYMHNVTAHLDDLTRRRLIEGDWSAFAIDKPYLYNFSLDRHVKKAFTPNPYIPIMISFDFNVEPMTAIIGQKLDGRTGYIFDEMEISTGSTEEMCNLIVAKYKDWIYNDNAHITGDATGRNRQALLEGNLNHYRVIKETLELRDSALKVPLQNPAHKDSRVLGNSLLQHANYFITENCRRTINDCIYAEVNDIGELIKTKQAGRHFFDNYRYMYHAWYPDFISKPWKYAPEQFESAA